jgi:hypothetical protein
MAGRSNEFDARMYITKLEIHTDSRWVPKTWVLAPGRRIRDEIARAKICSNCVTIMKIVAARENVS